MPACLSRTFRRACAEHPSEFVDVATTGELEEEQLFYLRARGIDLKTARGMLVAAFVGEALDEMQVDAPRAAFQAVVDDWLERRSEGQG